MELASVPRHALTSVRSNARRLLHIVPTVAPACGGPADGVIKSSLLGRTLGHVSEIVSLDLPEDPWVTQCELEVFALGRVCYSQNIGQSFAKRYGYSPYLFPWLLEHIGDYDAVILNGLWNYSSFAARRALQITGAPFFVIPHGMLDPWFRRTYRKKHLAKQLLWWWSEGWILNNASGVLFTSEEEKTLARQSFAPYRVKERVVPYGTSDAPPFAQAQLDALFDLAPRLRDRRFLLYLGRIHPKKGCDILIEAFARIAHGNPDLHLALAGPDQVGLRKSLEEQARQTGLSDRIHWLGMVQGDVKWGALRAGEALVLPSHQENFGVVVAEALACSLPVLISNKVNIWREIEKCGAGLVAPDDVDATCGMLRRFLALSPPRRSEMGRLARSCFLKNFDVRQTAKSMMEMIEAGIDASRVR